MKNSYFILRHGETVYQTKKRNLTYPWPETVPVKLTKKGEAQVKKSAKSLKKKKIDLIFSSDAFRTRQTAGIVANSLGLKVIIDKRLRDINLGIFQGKKKEEFYRKFTKNPEIRFYKRPQGGESWADLKKRMENFLKEIEEKYRGKAILIISHGDPLWILEGTMRGFNTQELLEEIFVKKNYINPGELRKL